MRHRASRHIVALATGMGLLIASDAHAQRQMEHLGRGMVAIHQGDGKAFVGWRMLGTDPTDTDTDGLGDPCDPTPLPEPGQVLSLVAGWLLLSRFSRRRRENAV